MSVNQQNNIPRKGDIIINPSTQRPVKVGSRTWLNLVKQGLVEGRYSDPKELYNVVPGDNVEEKIQELNKNLPINEQSVRGRGKYANKIIKRNKTPSVRDTAQYTAKVASKVVSDPEVYEKLQEADDFELQLENMIMAEMMGISTKTKARGRPKTAPCSIKSNEQQQQYYEEEPQEYDDFSEESD
tara:strand:+ start:629 stop:1183 length:555 start_codon:yes stop_codon:yes gene_type:complete